MRLNVYVDGFNLYYGAVRDTPYRWLDIPELCRQSFPRHTIHRVKYFTADVKPRPRDPDQPNRQKSYLNALSTLPRLTIHKGHFKAGTRRMHLSPAEQEYPRTVEVTYSEEKGSDVNLATELLMDAFRRDFEGAIIVSDDSDLIPPIRAVRQLLNFPVGVMNPFPEFDPVSRRRRIRRDLNLAIINGNQTTTLGYAHLNRTLLPLCLLPDPVVDLHTETSFFKPKSW